MPDRPAISRLAELLIEQADAEIERLVFSGEIIPPSERAASEFSRPVVRTVSEMVDSVIETSERGQIFTLGPISGILAAGQLLFGGPLNGERIVSVSPAFEYGPFRNRPKRAKPTPERRQRLARKIERAHRK